MQPEGRDGAVPTPEQVASFVEQSVQKAIREGAFDNLPGAGKPLPRRALSRDPDWWIKEKIERERLTGLAPDALRLRAEDERFDDILDALSAEEDVRGAVADFNRRIVEARRQLLGGPPVVTRVRDVDVEVERWRRRRSVR